MVLASREFQLIKSGQKIKGKEGGEEGGGREEEGGGSENGPLQGNP